MAVIELVLVEMLGGNSNVLLFSACVGEAQVDELDVLVFHQLENVTG